MGKHCFSLFVLPSLQPGFSQSFLHVLLYGPAPNTLYHEVSKTCSFKRPRNNNSTAAGPAAAATTTAAAATTTGEEEETKYH